VRTRITKTLLDSWNYMFDCAEGQEDNAREEFLTTLKREQTPPNEAQQAGLDFEHLVMEIAEGRFVPEWVGDGTVNSVSGEAMGYDKYPKNYAGAKKIAEIVQGGQWQVHVDTNLTVDGRDFWLHGFCDVVKAGVIYDVKFKTKSFGSLDLWGSYRHSAQHSAYLRCLPEAYQFVYLVSDGDDLYTETYDRKNSEPIENIIHHFLEWMKTEPELLKLYDERWVVDG
jgi:hypothetical protein